MIMECTTVTTTLWDIILTAIYILHGIATITGIITTIHITPLIITIHITAVVIMVEVIPAVLLLLIKVVLVRLHL